MVKTIFDDLFGDGLTDWEDLFTGLSDLFRGKQRSKPREPEPAPPPQGADDKLIEALSKCQSEYRVALSRVVQQTAVHVKHEITNHRLVSAYVRAAAYVGEIDIGCEVLDTVVNPTRRQQELRGLFHYQKGNYPTSLDILKGLEGHYVLATTKYAHASSLHGIGVYDAEKYEAILAGLESKAAPAASMIAVVHFNNGDYSQAEMHFDQALTLKPSDRVMLNYMTARTLIEDSPMEVIRDFAPRLYGELGYTGSIADLEAELGRKEMQFPRLKLKKMSVEMVDTFLR